MTLKTLFATPVLVAAGGVVGVVVVGGVAAAVRMALVVAVAPPEMCGMCELDGQVGVGVGAQTGTQARCCGS